MKNLMIQAMRKLLGKKTKTGKLNSTTGKVIW